MRDLTFLLLIIRDGATAGALLVWLTPFLLELQQEQEGPDLGKGAVHISGKNFFANKVVTLSEALGTASLHTCPSTSPSRFNR